MRDTKSTSTPTSTSGTTKAFKIVTPFAGGYASAGAAGGLAVGAGFFDRTAENGATEAEAAVATLEA